MPRVISSFVYSGLAQRGTLPKPARLERARQMEVAPLPPTALAPLAPKKPEDDRMSGPSGEIEGHTCRVLF